MSYFETHAPRLSFPLETKTAKGLRQAQIAAGHAISAHFFQRSDAALVVMPTGSGKTCVMMLATFMLRPRRVLVITPSRLVRDQIVKGFESLSVLRVVGAIPDSVPDPKVHEVEAQLKSESAWNALKKFDVVVANVPSVSPTTTGLAKPPDDVFDLVICDEAHHTPAPSWRQLLDALPSAKHLFFTATPFRRDAQALQARIIFEYRLAQAKQDGVFGKLEFVPVVPKSGKDNDLELIAAAESKLLAARKIDKNQLLMVRTSQVTRAEQLLKLYKKHSKLRLQLILGRHSMTHLRRTLDRLKGGQLDGVICVDMLGEGYDLPALKIAVLHSPHRSLAVTLQFIGRFARTSGGKAATARFLAVPSEIEVEAQQLYAVGAEWNELVERASRVKIDTARQLQEFCDEFEDIPKSPGEPEEIPQVELGSLHPYFHVKVYEISGSIDLTKDLVWGSREEVVLDRKTKSHHLAIYAVRTGNPVKWSTDDRLENVRWDLYILVYDPTTKFFFICTSQRDATTYDSIVESVCTVVGGSARRLAPDELNRALRDITNMSFFSIGMKNKSGFGGGESYRTLTGKAADKHVHRADGILYDRGHYFGKGTENGVDITVGLSSASKLWSNRRDSVKALVDWCRHVAAKLKDTSAVSTQSGLDNLPLRRRLTEFPAVVFGGEWSSEAYKKGTLRLSIKKDGTASRIFGLIDCDFRVKTRSKVEVRFSIIAEKQEVDFSYRLNRPKLFSQVDPKLVVNVIDHDGDLVKPLEDWLCENPPAFFAGNMSRIEGDTLSDQATAINTPFDSKNIEVFNWATLGINPKLEKPGKTAAKLKSLFEWVQARLTSGIAKVVFNDDGSGEVADYISIEEDASDRTVNFYHCKASKKDPIPGNRVEDLYEVAGQAVKSVRWTQVELLRDRLVNRAKQSPKRLIRGDVKELQRLLDGSVPTKIAIFVLQPGVSATPGTPISSLLAGASSYLRAAGVGPLRVLGSA